MRKYELNKYNFLFVHLSSHVLQVIVLIVSFTFLLCASFLCANVYRLKNRFSYIHQAPWWNSFGSYSHYSHSLPPRPVISCWFLSLTILFWHSAANFFYYPHTALAQPYSSARITPDPSLMEAFCSIHTGLFLSECQWHREHKELTQDQLWEGADWVITAQDEDCGYI